jgi:hypothetical protein
MKHDIILRSANFGKSGATLERIDAARQHIDIALDVYPYAASSTVLRLDRCDKGLRILITWHWRGSDHTLRRDTRPCSGIRFEDRCSRWLNECSIAM